MDTLRETITDGKSQTTIVKDVADAQPSAEKKSEQSGDGFYFPLELTISSEGVVDCGNPNCRTHHPVFE